ncbi:G3E family GTPase [Salana multivorans]|uniref:G3E family GTPase n=1 Tax=Salana multivorans TaxID=120377 RepID=A0A3N2D8W2_9MICO|nr:GTP-binding protein [Salana multivorans]ROR95894.1 G3E family GTPase [Salana multivorans]
MVIGQRTSPARTVGPPDRVPVVAVTGYLGAGKTSLLNHLLRRPGARLGVVVNDFGELNVDAALVAGQVDEAAAISGGCLCCLPDAGGLDDALERLAQPRLRLDAIIVEASGAAEPLALARLIRFSGVERVRPGGVIEVVDAVAHADTVDVRPEPPARYAAATLVVVGKTDLLPAGERDGVVARIRARVRERNPVAPIVVARRGAVDPALVFDAASDSDPVDELPIARLIREAASGEGEGHDHGGDHTGHGHGHDHVAALAASVRLAGPVSPSELVDLLEDPPPGAYRLKGRVRVRGPRAERGYVVNVVGRSVNVARLTPPPPTGELVAIGVDLDLDAARARLAAVAEATAERPDAGGLRRLSRHRRLSD